MSGHILESSGRWRATAEYHGSRGPSTAYLMDDGLIVGSHYWLVLGSETGTAVVVQPAGRGWRRSRIVASPQPGSSTAAPTMA